MKVYKVEATHVTWDQYDSVAVVAESEVDAILVASNSGLFRGDQFPLEAMEVDLTEKGVLHDSYCAG